MDRAGSRTSSRVGRSAAKRAPRESEAAGEEAMEAALPVESDLDYLVRSLRRRVVGAADRLLVEVGLPLSAWYPLVVLSHGDGISQRELARRLHLKDAAMGKAIDGLEAVGLLRRTDDPSDRRKFLVMLTPSGRKLAADIVSLRVRLLETMEKGFSAKEREMFKKFLQRAHANLAELTGPPEEDVGYRSLHFKRTPKK